MRRRVDCGKPALERGDDLAGVVDRKRRLRDIGEIAAAAESEPFDVVDRADQGDRAAGNCPIVPTTSGWPIWPIRIDVAPALEMDLRLAMDFRHQRAGRVDREKPAAARLLGHRLGDAVGGEDHRRAAGGRLARVPR